MAWKMHLIESSGSRYRTFMKFVNELFLFKRLNSEFRLFDIFYGVNFLDYIIIIYRH